MDAIERAVERRYEERAEENSLKNLLGEYSKADTENPGTYGDAIRDIKNKLKAITKFQGAVVRARADRLLANETPNQRFLATEKRYARAKDITEIEYNGKLTSEPGYIKKAFTEYYRELFSDRIPKEKSFERDFLSSLPTLGTEDAESLSADITAAEIETVIDRLHNGKSPGPDGITAVFYKAFKTELAALL